MRPGGWAAWSGLVRAMSANWAFITDTVRIALFTNPIAQGIHHWRCSNSICYRLLTSHWPTRWTNRWMNSSLPTPLPMASKSCTENPEDLSLPADTNITVAYPKKPSVGVWDGWMDGKMASKSCTENLEDLASMRWMTRWKTAYCQPLST